MSTVEIRNPDQFRILFAYARGVELATIASDTRLSQDLVNGTVSTLTSFNRAHAKQLVLDYERRRASAVTASKSPPASQAAKPPPSSERVSRPVAAAATKPPQAEAPTRPVVMRVPDLPLEPVEAKPGPATSADELLARAEQLGGPLVVSTVRIRGLLDDLAVDLYRAEEAHRVLSRIAALEQDLASARERLREVHGGRTAPTSKEVAQAVRAWAQTAAVECPPRGRIPNRVMTAYQQAHQMAKAS